MNETLSSDCSVYPVNVQAHKLLSTSPLVKLPEKEDAGLHIYTKSRNVCP